MAKYQKYVEYKDSGVEWLGEIPSHWLNTKVKYEAYVKARVGWHGLKSDDFTDEGPYLVTGSDFKGTNIDWSQCYHCDEPRYEQDPYIQLRDGDLLITKDGTIGKIALVSNLKDGEKATLNSGIFVVRPLRNNFSTKFYFWLLQSKVFKEFVDFNKTGSTIVHLYQDTFVNFEYASPNLEDQINISDFLDHQTAQIDTLIAKQEKLIELLKEKRQAVISHVVTKGLNPNVTIKDSGVEWLGQVPEHWGLVPLKYLCSFSGGGTPTKDNLSYWTDGNIPWVSPKDMKTFWISETQDYITEKAVQESSTNIVEPNSLLMVVRSGILQRTIPIAINAVPVTMNQDMKALKFGKRVLVEYLADVILGNTKELLLEWSKEGATVESIEHEYLANCIMPVPTLNEQKEIIQFISEKMNVYELLTKKVELQIKFLQERRTALISSVVRGKIDVRHHASRPSGNDKIQVEGI